MKPYGGELVSLVVAPEERDELRANANRLASIQLSERATCDLELLATGAFSPLDRFAGQADYESILAGMRTRQGYLFPIPVTLPVEAGAPIALDCPVALRSLTNELLAVMNVEEIYAWDVREAAHAVCGTTDNRHPLVAEMRRWGGRNISGRLQVLQLPRRYDFKNLRLTPAATREKLQNLGRENVVAFQTRNPLHRAHEEMLQRAMRETGGTLLLHPAVGMTKPGDVAHYTRVRTYKQLTQHYEHDRALLALIPLAMRMAGAREALWHGIIRRNYGANHLIVGRDHASPGVDSNGKPFYEPHAARELVEKFSAEIGVRVVSFDEFVYLPDEDRYEDRTRVAAGKRMATLSGAEAREKYLNLGKRLPAWFTRPETAEVLAEAYPSRHRQGVCVWFTGLSGAGKSTIAEILTALLLEHGRQVTLLDGDVVRTHLSQGLSFSREDRDANVRRIGFVAAEVVRHGGVAVCAAVSPYRATRNEVRDMTGTDRFVEVFVDTPLEVCEARDAKGMYAKARRGEITGFTGIDDPYEAPTGAELTLTTLTDTPEENARLILKALTERGFVRPHVAV